MCIIIKQSLIIGLVMKRVSLNVNSPPLPRPNMPLRWPMARLVVVTPRTFIASISCGVTCVATPVFADVDDNTQAISAQTIEQVPSSNTKAVIVVHIGVAPADMDGIVNLANKHDMKVIEDCAQAHGAR